MFSGLGNLGGMFQQARELGSKLQALQAELPTLRATGQAGAGLVEVEVNGLGEIQRVKLDPRLLAEQDAEMLEDLVVVASRQAQAKARELVEEAARRHAPDLGALGGMQEMLGKFLGGGGSPPG